MPAPVETGRVCTHALPEDDPGWQNAGFAADLHGIAMHRKEVGTSAMPSNELPRRCARRDRNITITEGFGVSIVALQERLA